MICVVLVANVKAISNTLHELFTNRLDTTNLKIQRRLRLISKATAINYGLRSELYNNEGSSQLDKLQTNLNANILRHKKQSSHRTYCEISSAIDNFCF